MELAPLPTGGGLRYLARTDWGAGPVTLGRAAPLDQFVGLVEHHTVSVMRDYDGDGFLHGDIDDVIRYMRTLRGSRPDLGFEVPYSWVLFEGARPQDAIVCEGRGQGRTGAHTKGLNSSRYGVAIAGNTNDRAVTPGMLEAFRWIGARFLTASALVPTTGHRDHAATACPGASGYAALPSLQPPFAIPAPEPLPEEVGHMLVVRHKDNGKVYRLTGPKREMSGPLGTELAQALGQESIPDVSGDLLGTFANETRVPTVQEITAAVVAALPSGAGGADVEGAVSAGLAAAFAAAADALDD